MTTCLSCQILHKMGEDRLRERDEALAKIKELIAERDSITRGAIAQNRRALEAKMEKLMAFANDMDVSLCAHSQPTCETEIVSGWVNQLKAKIRKLKEEL